MPYRKTSGAHGALIGTLLAGCASGPLVETLQTEKGPVEVRSETYERCRTGKNRDRYVTSERAGMPAGPSRNRCSAGGRHGSRSRC